MPFAPPPVIPDAVVTEQVIYYEIRGRNARELARDMAARGPVGPGGRHYWAYTSPTVTWTFDTRQHGSSCVVIGPSVRVTITIHMPRWTPPRGVEPSLTASWGHLVAALLAHERQHAQFARDAGRNLVRLMRDHGQAAHCDELDQQLQQLGRRILADQGEKDRELDARTRHGARDGVSF